MKTLCVILGRAGSKGLRGKNRLVLAGKPMVGWTLDHARGSGCLDEVVVSTDCEEIKSYSEGRGFVVVDRPSALAGDLATVDSAARHAVLETEKRLGVTYDAVVILYANVPVRPIDLTDRGIEKLRATDCDSVQSVSKVGKHHPYWMKRLGGADGDALLMYEENDIYRRQDLPGVYMLDGGLIVVKRESLMLEVLGEPHAFLGKDRRGIVNEEDAVVDIDGKGDLAKARAVMAMAKEGCDEEKIGFELGGKWVGREVKKESTYILAEIGVNHDGDVGKAMALVRMAKDAGADGVKFQLFEAEMLLSDDAVLAGYQKEAGADDVFTMLNKLQLGIEGLREAKDLAHELGMGFVVSCFSLELMGQMGELGVDAVKFASPDLVNRELIRAGAELGRPMILSVGASTEEEQDEFIVFAKGLGGQVALMGCVSSYPVPSGEESLGQIQRLKERWDLPVGYSDHSGDVFTGMLAVAAGATLIEKHVTYDREAEGPDHRASFEFAEFKKYCGLIRRAEVMMGDKAGVYLGSEKDVRIVSRQSVCVVRDMQAGEVLRRGDVTVKRPGGGIAGSDLLAVVGMKLTRDVQGNRLLCDEDIEKVL